MPDPLGWKAIRKRLRDATGARVKQEAIQAYRAQLLRAADRLDLQVREAHRRHAQGRRDAGESHVPNVDAEHVGELLLREPDDTATLSGPPGRNKGVNTDAQV